MKTLFFFFLTVNLFAQYDVIVPYVVTENADSAYILLWKGEDARLCPFVEDMDYTQLDMTGLSLYKVPVGSDSIVIEMQNDGSTFKLAGVVFKYRRYSDLSTSDFYALPQKPAKLVFGNIHINGLTMWRSFSVDPEYIDARDSTGSLPKRESGSYLYWKADSSGKLIEVNYFK